MSDSFPTSNAPPNAPSAPGTAAGGVLDAKIPDDVLADAMRDIDAFIAELSRVYQGPREVIEALVIALISRGHVLVEGVPGVAKTTLVRAFARALETSFKRIQFTPDLMPGDITGVFVLDMRTNEFTLRPGPIFAQVVLGDEINRAPAKTQAAMLEAMAERQVTIEGQTFALPEPFVVLATQNPVEQEGVYPLPEAQLDRFMLKVQMGYPEAADEVSMLRAHGTQSPAVRPLLSPERIVQLSRIAEHVLVDEAIRAYIVALARWTRAHAAVLVGASPRASLALLRASRTHALMRGRDFVSVDDVRALVGPVFAHRLLVSPHAQLEGTDGAALSRAAVRSVPYDPA